jgi:hypothetical protein
MNHIFARRFGAGAMTLLLGAASMSSAASAQDIVSGLAACRTLADAAARLQCYDRLADGFAPPPLAAPAPPPAPPVPTPPPTTAQPAPVAPSAREAANERFGQDRLPAEKRAPADEPDEIEGKVTALRLVPGGYVEVTLDTGQVWRQTEPERWRIELGAQVRIRKGVVGGFMLNEVGRNKSTRVRRME